MEFSLLDLLFVPGVKFLEELRELLESGLAAETGDDIAFGRSNHEVMAHGPAPLRDERVTAHRPANDDPGAPFVQNGVTGEQEGFSACS